jgi:hypothetical protein
MSSIRGSNSTFQASPIPSPSITLNMTNNALTIYLGNSTYPNITKQENNLIFNDSDIPKPNNDSIIVICAFIICCSLGVFLAQFLEKRGSLQKLKLKLLTLSPIVWIKNKYVEMNKNEVLPMYYPKKAKQSPFVSAMPMPQILPQCPRLEGAEKGQNNLQVRFSIPYRRFQSSENLPAEAEHRITITTTVEQTPQISKI